MFCYDALIRADYCDALTSECSKMNRYFILCVVFVHRVFDLLRHITVIRLLASYFGGSRQQTPTDGHCALTLEQLEVQL